ncbi:MAG: 1-deoxy-D-xylulose-5-phosphate synthase [Mycoplasmatales bacterium]
MYLEQINQPKDLNKLNQEELTKLCQELRDVLLYKLSINGGHSGPNLGVVELTVALHYVFDVPQDKIVFDVSHQTYIHKMLTGRRESFTNKDKFKDVTGYTDPDESKYDFFKIGHTATSISLGHGLAKARDLKREQGNIISVIGDGALSGGEALEGLNNVGAFKSNMIIIINDNGQSIAENHGGFYQNLQELREGNGVAKTNLFTAMGLDYKYISDGHNLALLISELQAVKDRKTPIVLHVKTIKGKGYAPAENNHEKFHAGGPINLETGEYHVNNVTETYASKTRDLLVKEMQNDPTVATITAGTPSILGFNKELREQFPNQFIDVGIAEEHAMAMVSAMAKNGAKPVFGVMGTFLQRVYDQISHDTAINQNTPTVLVYYGSANALTDINHLGIYDIAMISNIPNVVYLAPTSLEEHEAMLHYAIHQTKNLVFIRVPVAPLKETGIKDTTDYSMLNKFQIVNQGTKVALIGLGNFFNLAQEVQQELQTKYNINATLINPKFMSGVDEELLISLQQDHDLVITMEDGQIEGGFGPKVANFYAGTNVKVQTLGYKKEFIDRYDVNELLQASKLTKEQIIEIIKNNFN